MRAFRLPVIVGFAEAARFASHTKTPSTIPGAVLVVPKVPDHSSSPTMPHRCILPGAPAAFGQYLSHFSPSFVHADLQSFFCDILFIRRPQLQAALSLRAASLPSVSRSLESRSSFITVSPKNFTNLRSLHLLVKGKACFRQNLLKPLFLIHVPRATIRPTASEMYLSTRERSFPYVFAPVLKMPFERRCASFCARWGMRLYAIWGADLAPQNNSWILRGCRRLVRTVHALKRPSRFVIASVAAVPWLRTLNEHDTTLQITPVEPCYCLFGGIVGYHLDEAESPRTLRDAVNDHL